jgi:hypothetical protein
MTSTPSTFPRTADAPAPARAAERLRSATDWKVCTATISIALVLFLLLQNQYWVPGGDSEVYLAIAQNIVAGQGYMFNGQAARIAPPGWPLMMAAVIKFISPTFLALKLLTMASMIAALGVYYWILRRCVDPLPAAGAILLTAIISHVYPLTFWLHSDAIFTLITAAIVLVCLQINESRTGIGWRLALLLALCFAGAFVRWAGIINILLIGAALMQGREKLSDRRAWMIVALACVVTFGSFYTIRWGMKRFAPGRVAFEESARMDLAAVATDMQVIEGMEGTREQEMPGMITSGQTTYTRRIIGFGTWFSYLLWQPFRLATGIEPIFYFATLAGWIVALIILRAVWAYLRQMRWLLPAAFVYVAALCLNWPHATARYLVPIAPLIIVMIFRGLSLLADDARTPAAKRAVRVVGVIGIGSIILCNLALYAVDVWVMRSSNFYDRYEAGMYKPLIAAAELLNAQHAGHWQTCVNPEYRNLNKRKMSPTGLRILTMLTGTAVQQMPKRYTLPQYKLPNDREFRRNFLAQNHVRFYLEQPPVSPWRVQHFRAPWLQEFMLREPPRLTPGGDGWRLYLCDGASSPVQVALPEKITYPTRVPRF